MIWFGSGTYTAPYSTSSRGSSPGKKSSQGVKPTTQLHPVHGLRMSGTIPPLPHMPLWHAQALSFLIKCLDSFHTLRTLKSSEMLEINCVHTHTQFMPTEEFTTNRYMSTSNHIQAGLVLCCFFLCNFVST
jgi:hypothetical protein